MSAWTKKKHWCSGMHDTAWPARLGSRRMDVTGLHIASCSPSHVVGAYRPSDILFCLCLGVSPVNEIRLSGASEVRATMSKSGCVCAPLSCCQITAFVKFSHIPKTHSTVLPADACDQSLQPEFSDTVQHLCINCSHASKYLKFHQQLLSAADVMSM